MKNDFLVFRGGFGVHINRLFAERYKLTEFEEIHHSVLERHSKEVPPMDPDTRHVWRDESTNQIIYGADAAA